MPRITYGNRTRYLQECLPRELKMPYRFYLINLHRCLGSYKQESIITSSILQHGKQRKKVDHNFIVISLDSNKRTRHSNITDPQSNALLIHVKVCLQSFN